MLPALAVPVPFCLLIFSYSLRFQIFLGFMGSLTGICHILLDIKVDGMIIWFDSEKLILSARFSYLFLSRNIIYR